MRLNVLSGRSDALGIGRYERMPWAKEQIRMEYRAVTEAVRQADRKLGTLRTVIESRGRQTNQQPQDQGQGQTTQAQPRNR
jgi:hypothetical protein